jgi:putative NIF3 family GTP cyclohydrolase 1 type 2
MPPTLADADAAISALWPPAAAESWDAVGVIAGDPASEVTAIHLAVDAVPDTVDETLELGAQLLLTHHPLLLRGVTSVAEDRYKGVVLGRLIRGGSALIAAHTNADIVARGTSV